MSRLPTTYAIRLTDEQRAAFELVTRNGRSAASRIRHARVLLLSDLGSEQYLATLEAARRAGDETQARFAFCPATSFFVDLWPLPLSLHSSNDGSRTCLLPAQSISPPPVATMCVKHLVEYLQGSRRR